ncbi:MAG TPA: histidine kinase [Gaiellaceae bacterium]|jgi:signal transduction histidine kinase
MSRRLVVAVGLTAFAVTATTAALVLFAHDFQPEPLGDSLGQVVVDGIWIACGLVACARWPENRTGLLIVALGLADMSNQLYWDAAVPFTLATLVSGLMIPLTAHLFLAFPTGRLTGRVERRFVLSAYAACAVLAPAVALTSNPLAEDCPDCPDNLLRVVGSSAASDAVDLVATIAVAAIFLTLAVLLVRRLRVARGPTRRALAPVLLAAAAALLFLVAATIAEAFGATAAAGVFYEGTGFAYIAIPIAFLVGLMRTRLQRSGVADLVVELGSSPRPPEVRDAIARTLGDPSLEVAFWLPEEGRYVDPAGQPVDPDADPGRAVTPLGHDGNRLAALVHDPSLLDDPQLVEAVGAAATLTLENARLQVELRAQLEEVRASRARLVEAEDAERRRIERDLHDGAQQRLLGIRLALQLARDRIGDDADVEALLAEADAEVGGALEELRALARGIHPAVLTDEGLGPALGALARRAPVPVDVAVNGERFSPAVEATAYFVACEALANAVKHAGASRVAIDVTRTNGRVAIAVADDGVGGADLGGAGLRGLRDRVEALDGRLDVSSPAGGGTRVTAAIPCA